MLTDSLFSAAHHELSPCSYLFGRNVLEARVVASDAWLVSEYAARPAGQIYLHRVLHALSPALSLIHI